MNVYGIRRARMNVYRIDRLGSLAVGVDFFGEDEVDAAISYAWRIWGVAARFVDITEAFVSHHGSVGWIARIRAPSVAEIDVSLVVRICDAEVSQ